MNKILMLSLLALVLTGVAWVENSSPPAGAYAETLDPISDQLPGTRTPSLKVPTHPFRTDALVWTPKAPAPLKRYWGAVGSRLDTIYLAGGRMDTVGSTRTMLAYIPATNAWIAPRQPQTPSLPEPRRAGATGSNDTLLFYCCGRDSLSSTVATMYLFNMRTKTWSSGANCPNAAWSTAGAVTGNYFFRFGSELKGDTLFRYDINADTWVTLTPNPKPRGRAWLAAAGAGGLFYVFGGADPQNYLLQDCWAFDPSAGTWLQKADMPGPRIYHSAISLGDSIIVVSGGKAEGIGFVDSLVYVYHISTDTWTTEASMHSARGWHMMACAANKIYALQGSDVDTPTYLNVNEEGDLRRVGIESPEPVRTPGRAARLDVTPNPFTSFATLPGHEGERFTLYDITGRRVGVYKGDRIGANVPQGVYFMRAEGKGTKPLRAVKVR